MTVNIVLDSSLCALGLKYILSEYFDINANILLPISRSLLSQLDK